MKKENIFRSYQSSKKRYDKYTRACVSYPLIEESVKSYSRFCYAYESCNGTGLCIESETSTLGEVEFLPKVIRVEMKTERIW